MSLWTRAENVWLRIKEWWNRNWILIRPGPEAWRGGVWGALAAATACVVIAGLCLKTGFGYAFDFVFAIFFAALCIPLAMLGVMRSEEHTSELQSRLHLVCRLLLEKKNIEKQKMQCNSTLL